MTDQIQKQNAPYAVAAMVLGICSIVFGCMIVGLVCGIIGLVLAKKGTDAYNAAPDQFTGDGMLKAGKITSIIGIILSALGIVYCVIWVAIFGTLWTGILSSAM
ncbi:MAG: DUF4190 domain-containing protein [Bacteroidales bacterium]|nr:DUF4190 domain-containing protein [Bacteroidales bacterium]MBR3797936.1 DUF4190 domain-containing protein [Bacteroidales bacterium]